MHTNMDAGIVALDAEAVRASADLVARATAADLDRVTPCAGWTLRDLLTHMTAQHHGFAAAASGDGSLENWQPRPLGAGPVGAYQAAADVVLAAFAADGVLDREFVLPEFKRGQVFPAREAISFHFVDYVAHSWDVAKTLDVPLTFEPSLLDAALTVAEAVPGGDVRSQAGAPFAPAVPWSGYDGSRLDQIMAILGRSPAWRRP
jgi:uncharacterized protein (TIGR03086 family)